MGFNLAYYTQSFPLPGTATLHPLDRIRILNYSLPLARPIETGLELDIEKRKEPGTDYSSFVSHGIDAIPVKVTLSLFRDLTSGKDWFADYLRIKDKLVARHLSRRNAVLVYHPFLDLHGINQIIFVKQSIPTHDRGLIFHVTLEGYNPKVLRIGSATNVNVKHATGIVDQANPQGIPGKSKPVTVQKGPTAQSTAVASKKNYQGPAALNTGAATRRQG